MDRWRLRPTTLDEAAGGTDRLRRAYDRAVEDRDRSEKQPWKLAERAAFLDRLRAEGRTRLVEIGAGTGQDSAFFAAGGIEVLATDLSPASVRRCRAKGLTASVMDLRRPDLPAGSFDAAYSVNCLLHVPNAELPAALAAVAALLRPSGLFFLGLYGSDVADEGIAPWDRHDPPRFFSWRTDAQIQRFAAGSFEIVDFHPVTGPDLHFQSLTLRRPD
ncbi:bifunctional 2-polyprenyl-6-hydroxyphenol methylase/3-demethylubiquinol 3-O-methyltransferase UbiG [Plantactinospora sp. KBS50]|uniref:class I SAM-dependent methyltransferase n=1 Tax=Plantactinospora sp. KBS50 TaxID=2024580 RepID=UPI000BAADFFE|nr:class I SAM-dependent methyltransferase [Plantactinospora sp. KBS50]ASW56663.1 SAM-dependent methyltransferase [Plantactinospora sp. KBS50]